MQNLILPRQRGMDDVRMSDVVPRRNRCRPTLSVDELGATEVGIGIGISSAIQIQPPGEEKPDGVLSDVVEP
jgi:hypothetical protein